MNAEYPDFIGPIEDDPLFQLHPELANGAIIAALIRLDLVHDLPGSILDGTPVSTYVPITDIETKEIPEKCIMIEAVRDKAGALLGFNVQVQDYEQDYEQS